MFRIRFHGRGGQGMKTASRILGTAFFLEGFEVQDAPRYGAERRGAPIFAYVRASRNPINERGIIANPDLVIVADDSLIPIASAGVLAGLDKETTLLINSDETANTWSERLNLKARVLTLPTTAAVESSQLKYIGATCTGAAACLTGVISPESLQQAIRDELVNFEPSVVTKNLGKALSAFELMKEFSSSVAQRKQINAAHYQQPDWIELPFEDTRTSAPGIHAAANSGQVKTGLWRTMRPVIDREHCNKCWWVCSTFCPDGAIDVDAKGQPHIDYDHCKGCMVCVTQCPPHAIELVAEKTAQAAELSESVGEQT